MSAQSAESDAPECDHVMGYYLNPQSAVTCWDCGAYPDEERVTPPEQTPVEREDAP